MKPRLLDLFAGPGGWDVAARELGLDPLGIEYDDAACKTREAAVLRTVQGDVAALDPGDFAPCDGLIASPPCQAWSMAGKRGGERDKELVYDCARVLMAGRDERERYVPLLEDPRSLLVVEPMRYVQALRPRWVAFEQVPPVLQFWEWLATSLRVAGYAVWTGILSAERYGVPQTRKRAILMASLDGAVAPPEPTHQAFVKGEAPEEVATLYGSLLPWVSIEQALGWTGKLEHTQTNGSTREYIERSASEPAPTLAGNWRRWHHRPTHYDRRQTGGDGTPVEPRPVSEPAPTIQAQGLAKGRDRWLRNNSNANAGRRRVDEPAPTLFFGHARNEVGWVPDPDARVNHEGERITQEEAAVLQGFPADYPFQGSRSKRDEQIGNAVPPPLARAILSQLAAESRTEAAA